MDPINSGPGLEPQMYAMKKAMDTQAEGIMKILESIQPSAPSGEGSGAALTGLGQNLDIRA